MEMRPEVPGDVNSRLNTGDVLPQSSPLAGPAGSAPGGRHPRRRAARRGGSAQARRSRWRPAHLLLALGLAGLAVCAAGMTVALLPRHFSTAQRQRITAWELSRRWRTWPAGKIFPAAIPYSVSGTTLGSGTGLTLSARRVGIAPEAGCGAATDAAVARVLMQHGCLAVLRATYEDATGSLAVTVGLAILPTAHAALASARSLPTGSGSLPGLRAVPFPHTVVARFGDAQRQLSSDLAAGPYLVLATAGYTDGRPRVQETADPYARDEMAGVEAGIGRWVAAHVGAPPPAPHCPGSPGC